MRHIINKFLLLTVLVLASCSNRNYENYENSPVAKLTVQMSINSKNELNSILNKFAVANGYDLLISNVHPSEPRFSLSLMREDSSILGVNPFENSEYKFAIYARKSSKNDAKFYEAILNKLGKSIETTNNSAP